MAGESSSMTAQQRASLDVETAIYRIRGLSVPWWRVLRILETPDDTSNTRNPYCNGWVQSL